MISVVDGMVVFAAFLLILLVHGQELFQVGGLALVVVAFRLVRQIAHLVFRQRSTDHSPIVFVVLHGTVDWRRGTCRWPEGANCQHRRDQKQTNAELRNSTKNE